MRNTTRDVLVLSLGGLVLGTGLGLLAAGAYATWRTGGDPANVGFTTILAFAPSGPGPLVEPFRTAALIGAAIAVALTVGLPAAAVRPRPTSHGSARWSTAPEMRRAGLTARLEQVRGPIYGKLGPPRSRSRFISSETIPHSLIAAPTGSGKGVGVVIPTLLTYPGSVLCLDVKGENFEKTARQRRFLGDRVYRFSPYDAEGRSHRYNPLDDVVRAPGRRRFTEARRLAASFIVAHGSGQGFLEGARDLFAATAMLVIERGTPTVAAIYDALAAPGEAYKVLQALGEEAEASEARKIFEKLAGLESRVLSSYLTVLSDGGLGLWADPAVREATAASDFNLHDLRSEPASIYICVSPNDFVPLAPLIRVMVQQCIAILQRAEPDRAKGEVFPVLFLLDEFVSLGRMDVLADAITTLRSYGGRVMIVVQTMASLEKLYQKEGAAQFLANCRMQLFLSPADKTTPDYVSAAAGDFTRKIRSKTWRGGAFGTSYQERSEGARLIRPEEVRMLGQDQVVALVQNMYPIKAHRVAYYEDRALRRIFESQSGALPLPPIMPEAAPPGDDHFRPVSETSDEKAADATGVRLSATSEAAGGQGDRKAEDDDRASGKLAGLVRDQHDVMEGILHELDDSKRRNRARLGAGENAAGAGENNAARQSSGERAGKSAADRAISPVDLDAALATVRQANIARQDRQS